MPRLRDRHITTERYVFLNGSLLTLFVVGPMLGTRVPQMPALRILTTVVLIAALFSVSRARRSLLIGCGLAIPGGVLTWLGMVRVSTGMLGLGFAFEAAFLGFLATVVTRQLLSEDDVSGHAILAGISVYLLMAFLFNYLYFLVELVEPGSFQLYGQAMNLRALATDAGVISHELLYYSFTTLTTVGYGDITPVSQASRGLAALEAVAGQLYIAILVARLVGLHIAKRVRRDDGAE